MAISVVQLAHDPIELLPESIMAGPTL